MRVIFFENKFYPKGKGGVNFDHDFPFGHPCGIAVESQDVFYASGINRGGAVHFAKVSGTTLGTLKDWVARSFGDSNPVEVERELGTFYKRIWRPLAIRTSFHKAISQEKLNESFVSLRILLDKLEELFETVEPTAANLKTYGHKIREVLLLACMEVESSWTAVLKENQYPDATTRPLKTSDYVKLKEPMFLDVYDLRLRAYPNFPAFSPFSNWNVSSPTKSLEWYDAYNKTKHDREESLKLATLENAVYAVGAAAVMLHAQFGPLFTPGSLDLKAHIISNIFELTRAGMEKYEKEFYIPNISLQAESGKPSPSWEWKAVDYPF